MEQQKVYLEQPDFDGGNVPIEVAAKAMNKHSQYIRQGLVQKVLPFGWAFKKEGKTSYDYYISPKLFYECTGFIYEAALKKADPQGTSAHRI